MGTRSVCIFKDEDNQVLCSIWNKYDGGPDNFGSKLANFLTSKELRTMWSPGEDVFGGIGGAASQFVAYLKCYGHPYYPANSGSLAGLPDMKKNQTWRRPEIGHISLLPITLNLTTIRCDYVYVVTPNAQEEGFIISTFEHPKNLLFTCEASEYIEELNRGFHY